MHNGKDTCRILKEIRKQIAKENDIAFITSECKFQGNCRGTCPACEAEVRYLEEELRKRKQLGKTAIVTGVSLGLATSFLGCHFGGNADPTSKSSTPPEPAKQESTMSAELNSEQKPSASDSPKQFQRPDSTCFFGDERIEREINLDISQDKRKSTQPYASDTIEIIYEAPKFDLDGTVSSSDLPTDDANVHKQSSQQNKRVAKKGTE